MLPELKAIVPILAIATVTARSPVHQSSVPPDTLIKLERTQCFGTCPVYSVTIDAEGNVSYEGKQYVRVEGPQTSRSSVEAVAAILAAAERLGFFELRDRYRAPITDLPTTFVTIRSGGRTKRVEDYYGAPEGLRKLEAQIDAVANTRQWIRVDPEYLRARRASGWTPAANDLAPLLQQALSHDEVDVVQALIEIGADVNLPAESNTQPPIMFVRSAAATHALLKAGASIAVADGSRRTPLMLAAELEPGVAAALLAAGARVDDVPEPGGPSAIWLAACNGNAAVVQLLLKSGARPSSAANGKTALQCAEEAKNESLRWPRRFSPVGPTYERDFDAVMASLTAALKKGARRP